jgi:predicted ATPase with chaperone activity
MDSDPELRNTPEAENIETAPPPPERADEDAGRERVPTVPSFFSRTAQSGEDSSEVEPGDSMSAFINSTTAAVADPDEEGDDHLLPGAPRSFTEIGLSKAFLTDLTLKIIHYSGTPTTTQLVRRLGLNNDIVSQLLATLSEERLIEVMSQSDLYTGNYRYRLSERGQARVSEALERSRYAGPAPVTAEQYNEVMKRVLEAGPQSISRTQVKAILHDLVLTPDVADSLARALFSGKPAIIHGPSGNGKSVLLQKFAQDIGGVTIVPYAIYAYGQVIRVFDASIHQLAEKPDEGDSTKDEAKRDRRWVLVKRPAIILGAEMDREALELGYDPGARFYQAPPHLKAQNGALIIDDFGRQRISTDELLTRWLIPLDRGWDSLALATGEKLVVPFRIQPLFTTNLRLKDLGDDALRRRVLYKVQIPNPSPENFGEILRRECRARRINVVEGVLEHAVARLYAQVNLTPRGSYAGDLLEILVQSASFDNKEPVLDKESFDRVFALFLASEAGNEEDDSD